MSIIRTIPEFSGANDEPLRELFENISAVPVKTSWVVVTTTVLLNFNVSTKFAQLLLKMHTFKQMGKPVACDLGCMLLFEKEVWIMITLEALLGKTAATVCTELVHVFDKEYVNLSTVKHWPVRSHYMSQTCHRWRHAIKLFSIREESFRERAATKCPNDSDAPAHLGTHL